MINRVWIVEVRKKGHKQWKPLLAYDNFVIETYTNKKDAIQIADLEKQLNYDLEFRVTQYTPTTVVNRVYPNATQIGDK